MNAHTKPSDIKPAAVIPQGYGYTDELVAIRKLMRLGRHQEALERIEIWMDRNQSAWRTLA